MQPKRNYKKILAITSGIAIIAVVIVLAIALRSQPLPKLQVSKPFATNLAYAQHIGTNTLYYFSNSAFVSYDLTTHRTTALTGQYSLPSIISDVRIAKHGALIRATGYSQVDQLYTTLVNSQLDPNVDYWWYVDFGTGNINLVGDASQDADVRSAVWQDDQHFVFTEAINNKLNIIRQDLAGNKTPLGTLSIEAIMVAASSGTILFTEVNNGVNAVRQLVLATDKTTTILDNIETVLATNAKGSVLAIMKSPKGYDPETPRGPLTIYDAGSQAVTEITPDFRGQAIWDRYNNDWLATGHDGNNKPLIFTSSTVQEGRKGFTFETKTDVDRIELMPVGKIGKGLLITDESAQLYLMSETAISGLPKLPDYSRLPENVNEDTFSIAYDSDINQYNIYITQNPYTVNQQLALQYIQKLRLDPNQLKIKWYAYDGVTTGFELPPDITPGYILQPTPEEDPDAGE